MRWRCASSPISAAWSISGVSLRGLGMSEVSLTDI
jgi:hypothetical protein